MKYARKCDKCGCGMNQGYVIDGGCEYYCSDNCLHQNYSKKEWNKMHNHGNSDSYWTEWEDEDDYEFKVVRGKLVPIE